MPNSAFVDSPEEEQAQISADMLLNTFSRGPRIWQGVRQGLTPQQISQGLQASFEVEPVKADQSVVALVNELLQQQIAQPVERCADARP